MPIEVNHDQVARAIDALKQHMKKVAASSKQNLLAENSVPLHMQITLRTVPVRARANPLKIALPHAIIEAGTTQCMLITKDPHDEVKKSIKTLGLSSSVQKVISVGKLKTKFKQYEERRALLGAFDLFLADDRVLTALPRVLGSKFYERKKQPVAIRVDATHIKQDVESCFASTFLTYGKGTCISLQFAHSGMDTSAAVENFIAAFNDSRGKIGQQVASVAIKTPTSAALPVWSYTVDASVVADVAKKSTTGKVPPQAGDQTERSSKAQKHAGDKVSTGILPSTDKPKKVQVVEKPSVPATVKPRPLMAKKPRASA